MKHFFLSLLCIWIPLVGISQNYNVHNIPKQLTENAYAVVRNDKTLITIHDFSKMDVQRTYAVTILSRGGDEYANFGVDYNRFKKIKKFKATIYDKDGAVVDRLKNKDIRDINIFEGLPQYTDRRVQSFGYEQPDYPYTIEYEVETQTSTTAFIPVWFPFDDYNQSIQHSEYEIVNPNHIPLREKETGFDFANVTIKKGDDQLFYSVDSLPAISSESLSPGLSHVTPFVRPMLSHFQLEGVEGNFDTWTDFGKWYYNNLFKDHQELPQAEKDKVLDLVKNAKDDREKVQLLYQYMQSRTRYVNVSIEIGGWEPFPATYVSERGYGDCKALSNYMVSLLAVVGITAYPAIVFGNSATKGTFDPDFPAFEGNHMIVNVPMGEDTIWLECTSQQIAFDYLGLFTDNRNAVSVTPEGGFLVNTQRFPAEKNLELVSGTGKLSANGDLEAEINMKDTGLQYDLVSSIYFQDSHDQKERIQRLLADLPNLKIQNYHLENDRIKALFHLNTKVSSSQYGHNVDNSLIIKAIPVGIHDGTSSKKIKDRRFPFSIRFGYADEIHFNLEIPEGYQLTNLKEPKTISSQFGDYALTVVQVDPTHLLIKRRVLIRDGNFPKETYNDFVSFSREIGLMDNTKLLLEKKQ